MLTFSKELRLVLQERNSRGTNGAYPCLPNDEVDKRRTFRLKAINEIITSERNYIEQLEMLMRFFIQPLKGQTVIDDQSHTFLFGQIEMIYNLNGELLRELEQNIDKVAQAFLKIAPFLKLYSIYAFDFRNALLIIQELTDKNPVFRKFLEQTEMHPEVQRTMNSLMIVPIQRLPRYKLLLEQVLLYTSPAETDFKLLKESVKQIESIVSHINSCVEEQEVTLMLLNLQNSMLNRTPNIVKPSRTIIMEGSLKKITRNGAHIKRYCVLMSDIFMYCKALRERPINTVLKNALECCCIFPLKKCKVYELFPDSFKITCQGDGIILSSSDLQLVHTWKNGIREAIDLHIQCRNTLRKESSKRKPTRKKDIKHFDKDYVHHPNRKILGYEKMFQKQIFKTHSEEDDENDSTTASTGCFPCKKLSSALNLPVPASPRFQTSIKYAQRKPLKRGSEFPFNAINPKLHNEQPAEVAEPRFKFNKCSLNAETNTLYVPSQDISFQSSYNSDKVYPNVLENCYNNKKMSSRNYATNRQIFAHGVNEHSYFLPLDNSVHRNYKTLSADSYDKENDDFLLPPFEKRVKFDFKESFEDSKKSEAERLDIKVSFAERLRQLFTNFF